MWIQRSIAIPLDPILAVNSHLTASPILLPHPGPTRRCPSTCSGAMAAIRSPTPRVPNLALPYSTRGGDEIELVG
jgi:hypothetical protein